MIRRVYVLDVQLWHAVLLVYHPVQQLTLAPVAHDVLLESVQAPRCLGPLLLVAPRLGADPKPVVKAKETLHDVHDGL